MEFTAFHNFITKNIKPKSKTKTAKVTFDLMNEVCSNNFSYH